MKRPIYVQGQEQFRYEMNPESFLGRGAVGDVYRTDDGGHVVKVAGKAEYRESIREEYDLMEKLYQAQATRLGGKAYTPKPYVADDGLALVMPLYSVRLLDPLHEAFKRSPLEGEILATYTALQYLEVLRGIEAIGHTCLDRKLRDIFWVAEAKHIAVIDWNIVDELNNANRQAQFVRFAQMWYEMLTGYSPRPPFLPFDDSAWQASYLDSAAQGAGVLSLGFRLFLKAASEVKAEDSTAFHSELQRGLQEWLKLLQKQSEVSERHLAELFASQRLSNEQLSAVYEDLDYRLGRLSLESRNKALSQAQGALSLRLQAVKARLGQGEYGEAIVELGQRIADLPLEGLDLPKLVAGLQKVAGEPSERLAAVRWAALSFALYFDNQQDDTLRPERPRLMSVLEILATQASPQNIMTAKVQVDYCHKLTPVLEAKNALAALQEELDLRLQVAYYQELWGDPLQKRLHLAQSLRNLSAKGLSIETEAHLDWDAARKDYLSQLRARLSAKLVYQPTVGLAPQIEADKARALAELARIGDLALSEDAEAYFSEALRVAEWADRLPLSNLSIASREQKALSIKIFEGEATRIFDAYRADLLEKIKALGTVKVPQWMSFQAYHTGGLRHLVHVQNITHLREKAPEHAASLDRAEEVRQFCDHLLDLLEEAESQPAELVAFVRQAYAKRIDFDLDGQEGYRAVIEKLISTLENWDKAYQGVQAQLATYARQVEDQHGRMSGTQATLKTRLEEANKDHARLETLVEVWSYLNRYDVVAAENIAPDRARLLSPEEVRAINEALARLKSQDSDLLRRAYVRLVGEGRSLDEATRQALRDRIHALQHRAEDNPYGTQLASDSYTGDLERLLSLDMTLRQTERKPAVDSLYQAIATQAADKLDPLREVISAFLGQKTPPALKLSSDPL